MFNSKSAEQHFHCSALLLFSVACRYVALTVGFDTDAGCGAVCSCGAGAGGGTGGTLQSG